MGPAQVTRAHGLDIGPHPHTGLQTLTWLVEGEAVHHDSLGTEQLLTPGQLNLMTAGVGVSHSEEATSQYEGVLQGIQLWIAQPEATRFLEAAFEHHRDLPRLERTGFEATVLVGEFEGVASAARRDTDLVGLEVVVHGPTNLPLDRGFEYAIIVLEGTLLVRDEALGPGHLGYLSEGEDELFIDAAPFARAMVLGGVPFESDILMWWNFVTRSREEIDVAFDSWRNDDGRFGTVDSSLERIETPAPYWHSRIN
jgi:redox-sensitive bicupin YhaK (pirin superfamily)